MRQCGKILSYLGVPALALAFCFSTIASAQTPTSQAKSKKNKRTDHVRTVPAPAVETTCMFGRNADLTCVSPRQHAAVQSTQTLSLIAATVGTNQNVSAYGQGSAAFAGYPNDAQQHPFNYVSQIGINSGYKGSDIRFKRDVTPLAIVADGVTLYSFRYFWSDQVYVGVMAQQVAEIMPEAVAMHANGFLYVNYDRLGLKMQTLEEWQATHGADAAAP